MRPYLNSFDCALGAAASASEKLSRHDSQSPAMSTSASVPSSSHQQLQYMASSAIPPGYHHYYAPSAAAGYGPHLYSMYNTPNTFNAAPKQYSNYNSTSTTSTGGAATGVADHYGGSKSAYDKNFQSSTTPPYNLPPTQLPQVPYGPPPGQMMNMMMGVQDRVSASGSTKGGNTNKYYSNNWA